MATPHNRLPMDWLGTTGYRMFIKRLPNTAFTVQTVAIPNVTLSPLTEATPFVGIPKYGTQLIYNELNLKFLVDENLTNYLEIYTWMKDLGTPDSFEEFRQIVREPGTGVTSDIVLYILDAKKNMKFQVTFFTAVPVSLNGLTFDATVPNFLYLSANMTLAYRSFDIEQIG